MLKEEIVSFKVIYNSIQLDISNPPKYREERISYLLRKIALMLRDLFKCIKSKWCVLCSELGEKNMI